MRRSHYIIGALALVISMPYALQAQTTQPKDTTMNRTVVGCGVWWVTEATSIAITLYG